MLRLQEGSVPEGAPGTEERQQALAELRGSACTLAQLYNDHASRFRLWPLAIRAVDLARHDDAKFVTQLWDVALRQARPRHRHESLTHACARASCSQSIPVFTAAPGLARPACAPARCSSAACWPALCAPQQRHLCWHAVAGAFTLGMVVSRGPALSWASRGPAPGTPGLLHSSCLPAGGLAQTRCGARPSAMHAWPALSSICLHSACHRQGIDNAGAAGA